jgi:drug/metabolite transporter (DMT)-like permease
MKHRKLVSSLMLIVAALIWGTAFVAQRKGMEYAGPLAFNGVRTLIGSLVLLPVALIFRPAKAANLRKTLLAGLLCGLCLFMATNLQQIGLTSTEAGKAGFITTFYIILVPVLGLFLRKKTGAVTWLAVAVALGGLFFLCVKPGEVRIAPGDLLVLGCAFFFAVQILVIDFFVQEVDGVLLSCVQFAVDGVLSLIAAFLFEKPDFPALFRGWIPLLYTGILSCGVAYTLQILGQKNLHPTVASLLMSLESAFAVLGGWLILHERLTRRELLGCALMLAAVLLVQLAPAKKEKPPAS